LLSNPPLGAKQLLRLLRKRVFLLEQLMLFMPEQFDVDLIQIAFLFKSEISSLKMLHVLDVLQSKQRRQLQLLLRKYTLIDIDERNLVLICGRA
jgi:hypothetical protein